VAAAPCAAGIALRFLQARAWPHSRVAMQWLRHNARAGPRGPLTAVIDCFRPPGLNTVVCVSACAVPAGGPLLDCRRPQRRCIQILVHFLRAQGHASWLLALGGTMIVNVVKCRASSSPPPVRMLKIVKWVSWNGPWLCCCGLAGVFWRCFHSP